jgi:phosphatidylinositol alpha 1,6-mannosyltransferase
MIVLSPGRCQKQGGKSRGRRRRPERRVLDLRVVLVTETFFPQVNGVSRTLAQLERHLASEGVELLIVHPDYGPTDGPSTRLTVGSIRMPFYPDLRVPIPPFGSTWRQVAKWRPSLIHVVTEATLGLSALRFARRNSIPIVSSFHTNFDMYTAHYGLGWMRGLIWRYLRWFHNLTAEKYVPSRATIRDLEARGFERLVLWPRGVDSQLFRPNRPRRAALRAELGFSPHDIVVGHVGRLAAEKNIGELAASINQVLHERPQAKAMIVGDGPARADLESSLGPSARFVGFRTGDDLADHYSAFDLFAFASTTETFGNVVLEAMSSGLPVVAVRAGGPGDIVRHGETGLLVELEDPFTAHSNALIRLIDDPRLRTRIGEAARSYAEDQGWGRVMARLLACYREVAASQTADVVN